VAAHSFFEWRATPARLNAEAIEFLSECWSQPSRTRDAR
jgi:hypothetical protein